VPKNFIMKTKKIKTPKQENVIIGIYKITSPSNKVYIGQSSNIESRFGVYRRLECKRQPVIYKSLIKYGWKKHKFEIIEICYLSQINQKEVFYKRKFIKKHGWSKALFCEIKDAHTSGKRSEETKRKIGLANNGLKRSEETKNKLRIPKTNKIKNKISKSLKGRSKPKGYAEQKFKPIKQLDKEGNLIKIYNSVKNAAKLNNFKQSNISCCLIGFSKTAYGFRWKYEKEKKGSANN
jgi:group I intron endonuclease